jgi:Calcineurin-like phosphoesterase
MLTTFHVLSFSLVVMTPGSFNNDIKFAFGSNNFNFAAAGDFGCNDNTNDTIENVISKEPELILGLGDYSYKTTISCWLDLIEPIDKKIFKISIGNHETPTPPNSSTSLSYFEYDRLMKHFNLTKQYYSFGYKNVHFLAMSTELEGADELNDQYNFVNKDLSDASKNLDVDWIIVFFHKPFYSLPTKNFEQEETRSLRDAYEPLFRKYNIDLVLQSHNHNYQRIENRGSDEESRSRDEGPSTTFVVVGTAGAPIYHFVEQENGTDYVEAKYEGFGFLNVEVIGDRVLKGKFYSNSANSVEDQFDIRQ